MEQMYHPMAMREERRSAHRKLSGFALTLVVFLAAGPPALANHRARLSSDLAELVARGGARPATVIVHGDRATVEGLAARHGVRVKRFLSSGAVLEPTPGQLDALSRDPTVDHLSSDQPIQSQMAIANQSIGADQLWSAVALSSGLTGRGVGVAIIDSGMAAHSSLRDAVAVSVDFVEASGAASDAYGHGTHVAGIVAAAPPASPAGVQGQQGVAPGAHLINLRVLGPDGSGWTSDVIEAIDWAIANRARYAIRVINLSLGHPVMESYRDDPLCEAVERAVAAGLVVVASAGNMGKAEDGTPIIGGISSPGNSPYAITVGALNTRGTPWRSDDAVTTYSSRGPTRFDFVLKPDLVAPGNRIVSLEAAGSGLLAAYPEAHLTGDGDSAYFQMSGSSMAAASVSGGVALLLEAIPSLSPIQVKVAMQLTASSVQDAGVIDAGAGSLNLLAAVGLALQRTTPTDDDDDDREDGGYGPAGADLPAVMIAGESVSVAMVGFWGAHLGLALVEDPFSLMSAMRSLIVTADGRRILRGDGRRMLWGDRRRILWGDGKRILWGDGKRILWGDGKRILWGDGKRILWGDRSIGADGKRILWGDQVATADGKRILWGDTTVTSEGKRILWGDGIAWGDEP